MKIVIKSFDDLLQIRSLLLKRFLKERDKLLELERKTDKPTLAKQKCIDTINTVDQSLVSVKNIATKVATFQTLNFAHFLANMLTLTETDEYTTLVLNLPDSSDLKYNTYYLICDKSLADFVKENVDTEGKLVSIQRAFNDRLLVILSKDTTFPLDYYLKISPQIAVTEKLEKGIYKLIDLGIKEPKLTEEEKMSKVLSETLSANIRKSNGLKK